MYFLTEFSQSKCINKRQVPKILKFQLVFAVILSDFDKVCCILIRFAIRISIRDRSKVLCY